MRRNQRQKRDDAGCCGKARAAGAASQSHARPGTAHPGLPRLRQTVRSGPRRRSAREATLGASADGAIGLITATAGVIVGTIVGARLLPDAGAGATIGAVAGVVAGRAAGGILAGAVADIEGAAASDAAVESGRDIAVRFGFDACRIVLASDVVRGPLVSRIVELGLAHRPIEESGGVTEEETLRFLDCTVRSGADAGMARLHLIRANQAACAAIVETGRRIVADEGERLHRIRPSAGSVMPFAKPDPECDDGTPREVWAAFVQDQRQGRRRTIPATSASGPSTTTSAATSSPTASANG